MPKQTVGIGNVATNLATNHLQNCLQF